MQQPVQDSVQGKACHCGWIGATIGRKQLIAVTGLGLSLFLLLHMAGNMLILVSPQAYNEYGHAIVSNPLLPIAETGLVLLFFLHLGFALRLQLKNWCARDSHYAVMSNGDKGTGWIQRSLWAQGLLILIFVILHLITFKYGEHYSVNYGRGEIRDLHKLIVEVFYQPGYVVWYLVSLVILGLHLSHGVGSSLQTLGIHHPRYQKLFKCVSWGYAFVVAAGFISQPIYVYFIYRG